jgi:hypothetical protein
MSGNLGDAGGIRLHNAPARLFFILYPVRLLNGCVTASGHLPLESIFSTPRKTT